ncbi:MAG: hypothetical protein ACRD03_06025 [Acidimicrobiales bacterium]
MTSKGRGGLAAMAAAGAAFVLSVPAFACVAYKGSLGVSQGTTGATNVGDDTHHGLCKDEGPVAIDLLSSNKVVLETAPYAGDPNCPASQLSEGTYSVRIGGGYLTSACMNGMPRGSHVVDGSGYGYSELDALLLAPGDISVCLVNLELDGGMEMRLDVL